MTMSKRVKTSIVLDEELHIEAKVYVLRNKKYRNFNHLVEELIKEKIGYARNKVEA